MELLSQIIVSRPEGDTTIQLFHGDLTIIPPSQAVDILVVSAFPGNYEPRQETLTDSLANAGLSVGELAVDKEVDLLDQLGCWLSKPLSQAQQERFNFKKVLCFEPRRQSENPEKVVGNLFRCINLFALDENHNDIAMPVLASGNQLVPLELMFPALIDTALFWLETGLPLKSLKFVLYTPEQLAIGYPIFEHVRKQYALKKSAEAGHISVGKALTEINALNVATPSEISLPKMEFSLQEMNQVDTESSSPTDEVSRDIDLSEPVQTPVAEKKYDFFISYSHKHGDAVLEFVGALQARNPALTIFYDRDSIPSGGLWIKMISDAIQNSKNVICILTPEYSKSDVCWDEFQCAYIMEKRKKLMIRTINYCNDADLPPMIAIYSYIDCTEGDLEKLKGAVDELIKS